MNWVKSTFYEYKMFIYTMKHCYVNSNPPSVITKVLDFSSLFSKSIKVWYTKIRNDRVAYFSCVRASFGLQLITVQSVDYSCGRYLNYQSMKEVTWGYIGPIFISYSAHHILCCYNFQRHRWAGVWNRKRNPFSSRQLIQTLFVKMAWCFCKAQLVRVCGWSLCCGAKGVTLF